MKSNACSRWVFLLAAVMALPAIAAREDDTDHPLLSRVEGVKVRSKKVASFDVVRVQSVVGEMKDGAKEATFEGKVTHIEYENVGNGTVSQALILRNYLAAAKQLGGQQLNTKFDANDRGVHVHGKHIFALAPGLNPPIAVLDIRHGDNEYELTIVEPMPMKQSVQVGQVRAAQLAADIQSTGFATVHINFDTGKSQLKEDGISAVREIAALLKNDPALKLSIEGHTDNVGTPESNKQLSHARANAVMNAVVTQGIAAGRLKAAGHGQEMPVADNRSEAGRAKNRRVELIKAK